MSYTTQLLKKYLDLGIIQDNSKKINWAEVREVVGGIIVLVGMLFLMTLVFSL